MSADRTIPDNGRPYNAGDRVVVHYAEAGWFDGKHGKVARVIYKPRPRGKTPGWWAVVRCDPPKGIKKAEVEIHANHLELEHA